MFNSIALCRGGAVAGALSQYIGRRLTIMWVSLQDERDFRWLDFLSSIFVLLVGAFIPLWILPDTFSKLAAGAFCVQFGVQG